VALLVAGPDAVAATPYRLGQGHPLPWLGLTVGGYISVRASSLEGERAELAVQDLSLFLHRDFGARWHFFSEMELGNAFRLTRDGLYTSDSDFDIERLYLDHNLSPKTSLRIGKFLTPVGRWNLVHADPLVWSVSRPLTTGTAFSRHATGVELLGSWPVGLASVDYQLFADDTAELDPSQGNEKAFVEVDPRPNPRNAFDHAAGLQLRYRTFDNGLELGLSLARFTLQDQPRTHNLIGADLLYAREGMELSAEAVRRSLDDGHGADEWGGFVQLVVPLWRSFYAVACHERYRAETFPEPASIDRLGITYRPQPAFSIKLERRETRGEKRAAPDGWLLSIAVLL